MTEQTPIKKTLRGRFLGRNARRIELLTLDIDGEEVIVEVREPTVADREAIFEAGGSSLAQTAAAHKAGVEETAIFTHPIDMFIECCLRCTFVPGTGEQLFVEADRDEFHNRPQADANAWMSRIGGAVMRLMGNAVIEKKDHSSPSSPALATTDTASSSTESPKPQTSGTSMASPSESSPPS
jgi:hypothetical protein